MKQFRHLITSGCSFTDVKNNYTWPLHVGASYSNITCNHLGLASQGNGLIARKAIHAVHDALKQGYTQDEILVGIMWSGPDRHDTYFTGLNYQIENNDEWSQNPTHVVKNDSGGWLIMNHHWAEKTCKIYYSHLHDYINHRINTYEKILWVQNYFDNLGVKYFMTNYMDDEYFKKLDLKSNPNIKWLLEQINYSNWLPIDSMHSWIYNYWTDEDYMLLTVDVPDIGIVNIRDTHPLPHMHSRFVEEVILPFIKTTFADYFCPEFTEYSHCV